MYRPLPYRIFNLELDIKSLEDAIEANANCGTDSPELELKLSEARETLLELKLEERKLKLKENLKRKNRKVNKAVNEELEKVREALKKSNRDFEAFENYEHGNKNL